MKVVKITGDNTTTKPLNQNRMKTAVEWLIEKMSLEDVCKYSNELAEAKEMEKQQIKNAYYTGGDDVEDNRDREAENYYNETFKSE